MAESLPAITLTDANDQEKEPSRPFSPTTDAPVSNFEAAVTDTSVRPLTPTERSKSKSSGRSEASSGRASPSRLRRTRSNNAEARNFTPQEETNGDGKAETQQISAASIDPLSQVLTPSVSLQAPLADTGL